MHIKSSRNLFRDSIFVSCLVLSLASSGRLLAQSYNDVSDFSIASNPSGTWSYGTSSAVTGGSFTAFDESEILTNYSGAATAWSNGGTYPDAAAIVHNETSSTITDTGFTDYVPTDTLQLDGEDLVATLRWTAPETAVYDLSSLFERVDTSAEPVDVYVIENGTTSIFSATDITGNGTEQTFSSTDLALTAGTTLDFDVLGEQASYDSTGVAATITVVPEPATYAMMFVGFAVLAWRLRRKRA
jgi:hypothetical protein